MKDKKKPEKDKKPWYGLKSLVKDLEKRKAETKKALKE